MPFTKITKIEKKRLLTLVICLLLAVFAWFFVVLNKEYVYPIKAVLRYENLPKNKTFKPLQADTVILKVKSSGWRLFFSKQKQQAPIFTVDLSKLKSNNRIVLLNQLKSNHKTNDYKVISIIPNVLYFDFTKQYSKKVPIRFVNKITFKKNYGLLDSIALNPSWVTIYGEKNKIENIKFLTTERCDISNVDKDMVFKVSFPKDKLHRFNVYPNQIKVSIKTDEYTEKVLNVPIKILNNKDFDNVKIWPKTVECVLLVPLSKYRYITSKDIELGVNLLDWRENKKNKLYITPTKINPKCKLVVMKPYVVDFIIEK